MNGSEYGLVPNGIFGTYLELYECLQTYQEVYKVTMSRSNSRLIQKEGINEELVYVEISYKCKKSGIYKPKGKGIRKTKSTKTNCPAFIEVRLSKNRKFLEIMNICLKHNHDDMFSTGETDKQPIDNSADKKILEQSNATEGLTPDTSTLPEDGIAGLVTSLVEFVELDSSMPCQMTDLLEITYAAEDQFEEVTVGNEEDLLASIGNLSVDEDTKHHSKTSGATMTKTSEVSNPKKTDVVSTAPETDGTAPKCTLVDSSGEAVHFTSLQEITFPNTRSKGRPRGRALMAIGLPIKKNPVSFVVQRPVIQARMILRWLISDEKIIENALTGEYLIQEGDLPSDPKDLPDSIVASGVDLSVLTQYTGKAAFRKLNKLVQKRKDAGTRSCRTCNMNLSEPSILCASCLCWYDHHCIKFKRAPKSKEWFCPTCKQ